jgi:methylenetetrahydrofolate dehydrogenase (NADP+)/methenyltetrahydrofolate cyclohydrolase
MIVDGRAIAADIYRSLDISGRRLGIIVGADDAATRSFIRIKRQAAESVGVEMVERDLPVGSRTEDVIEALRLLAQETDGIIVQLPLAHDVDAETVLRAIPADKDVDGINPSIPYERKPVFPPVALAVMEILVRGGIEVAGKKAVVVGAGRLVGAPTAFLLARAGATVAVVTKEEGSLDELRDADIVVSGAGVAGLIRPEMLRNGVALVDAGTSNPPSGSGRVAGDADPACAEQCSLFTPVPGGVGPVAVAMIFKNLAVLKRGQ